MAAGFSPPSPVADAPSGDQERETLRERFAAAAAGKLRDLRLEDLLSFLSARRVAPGAQSERFKHGFASPDGETDAFGRDRLLAYLTARATRFTSPAEPSEVVLGLVTRDGPGWRAAWRQYAAEHLTGQLAEDDSAAAHETLRYLLLAAAVSRSDGHRRKSAGREPLPHDDPAGALQHYADERDMATARAYEAILAASGRTGDATDLATIVNALIDGLSARAVYDRDPERLQRLLADAIIPVTAALSRRDSEPEVGEERMMLGDVAPPATRAYGRSPALPVPLAGDELAELTGTWRGTMFTDLAVKNDMRSGPSETYLSVDAKPDGLAVTSFVEGGLSRMIAPAFFNSGGRRRLVCAYEAELNSNPTPERPAHRGAWVLETTADGRHMTAAYFNDRHKRGVFFFEQRDARPAASFPEAKGLFDRQPWTSDVDVPRHRNALVAEHGSQIDLPEPP